MALKRKSDVEDDEREPYPVPNPEWTPKQRENWDQYGSKIYEHLETWAGKHYYRRTWRPKKRNEGMMKHDYVKLGTPEDYVAENVEATFDPWGNITSTMMREIGVHGNKDELKDAIADIVRARLLKMQENDPKAALRLVRESKKVERLYGIEDTSVEDVESLERNTENSE